MIHSCDVYVRLFDIRQPPCSNENRREQKMMDAQKCTRQIIDSVEIGIEPPHHRAETTNVGTISACVTCFSAHLFIHAIYVSIFFVGAVDSFALFPKKLMYSQLKCRRTYTHFIFACILSFCLAFGIQM